MEQAKLMPFKIRRFVEIDFLLRKEMCGLCLLYCYLSSHAKNRRQLCYSVNNIQRQVSGL